MKEKGFSSSLILIVSAIGIILVVTFIYFQMRTKPTISQPTSSLEKELSNEPTQERKIELEGFRKLTDKAICAGKRNQLFVIDNKFVFWERAGNCPDNSYAYTLFGSDEKKELCVSHDSIAGPRKFCQDGDFTNIFETIISNLEKNDLGLGSSHQVQKI